MDNEFFDTEVLRSIETLPLVDARAVSIDLLQKSRTRVNKKQHLIRDIELAPSSREVSRIMWNTMLSGMGLSILDSAWQKSH